jgi:protein SCO1/2
MTTKAVLGKTPGAAGAKAPAAPGNIFLCSRRSLMSNHGNKPARLVTALLLLAAALLTCLPTPATAAASSVHGNSVWGASYFPDLPLVSQDGKTLRFFSDLLKGKVVAINFIFTSDPAACAIETARLREVQRILGDRVGSDVFIYSISIDPAHDTPKVLKAYADKFQVGPGWLFLTGKAEDVTELRKKLGIYRGEKDEKLEHHESRLIVGNQSTGQWMKLSPYENPYVLAAKMGSWLHNWKLPNKDLAKYSDAPKLREPSMGETLYRTECATCHTIGAQPVVGTHMSTLGPDLFGVTRTRSQQWLTRWLAETDKVLAEKDPLAMQLLAKYNNLPMPNLRLNELEVQAVLTFIEDESNRLGQLPRPSAEDSSKGHGKTEHH